MLVSEAIALIRERINDNYDTGYSDNILINYINDAVKYLAGAMIARHDPYLTKEYTVESVSGSNPIPDDFIRFAGGYPVKRKGNQFLIINGSPIVNTKYFYMPKNVSVPGDSIPFDEQVYQAIVINLACIYALNQHEFNVQQDEAMKQELEKIIVSALGAIE